MNKLYTLEVNYWGKKVNKKMLKEDKLMKNNLRIVKSFNDFYNIKDFKKIGRNLAKGLVKYFDLQKKTNKNDKEKIESKVD